MKLPVKFTIAFSALLICMGFFVASAEVLEEQTTSPQAINVALYSEVHDEELQEQYAYDVDEPYMPLSADVVHAEINGTVLRVEIDRTWFDTTTVYINDRRFHHSAGASLSIDISRYITSGETIAVFAANEEGYISNIVLLTPPPPPPPNITPDGQGEVVDHVMEEDGVEFFTIATQMGNIFHLIIDHSRESNNVYFLNAVTEWDLMMLAYLAELPEPEVMPPRQQAQPPTTQVVAEEPQEEPTPAEEPEPEPELEPESDTASSGGIDMRFVMLAIMGVGGLGAVAYVKFFKGKPIHEDDDDQESQASNPETAEFEDVVDNFDDGIDSIDEIIEEE